MENKIIFLDVDNIVQENNIDILAYILKETKAKIVLSWNNEIQTVVNYFDIVMEWKVIDITPTTWYWIWEDVELWLRFNTERLAPLKYVLITDKNTKNTKIDMMGNVVEITSIHWLTRKEAELTIYKLNN